MDTKLALTPVAPAGSSSAIGSTTSDDGHVAGAFGALVSQALSETAAAQQNAAQLAYAAAQGENINSQDLIMAISKAELTLQTMVTIRDRATQAYNQIMQMPI